jgi:hypothetical protein
MAAASEWPIEACLDRSEGGVLCLAMHLATEVWLMLMPSLKSSPWTLGALATHRQRTLAVIYP